MNENLPAVATFKQTCPQAEPNALIAQMLADKGLDNEMIGVLARNHYSHLLATLFGHFVMRSGSLSAQRLLLLQAFNHTPQPQYQGTREENALIDASITQSQGCRNLDLMCLHTMRGAAGVYTSVPLRLPNSKARATRIIIIGAGAAGLLTARALIELGFTNLLLFDWHGSYGGIWAGQALQGASRANPFPLVFLGHLLDAAPGGSDAVMHWLSCIASENVYHKIVQARVLAVQPGDLTHRILYTDMHGQNQEITAPIVINTTGIGEPLAPSRPGVMTTDVDPEAAGTRWQQIWTPDQARGYQGQMIIFVSLSNSTLEMVKQIQHYRRQGIDIEYRILTHYPDAALAEPTSTVEHQGNKMRLYRSPERSQLLRLAGDLPDVNATFEEARNSGRIISHVSHWSIEQGAPQQMVVVHENDTIERFTYHQLYTLIGYGPRAETLQAMGLSVNHPYLGAVDLDYDGEVQRQPGVVGRDRLYPGYFALGLRNAFNQNEVLLPGLLFRLPDMIAGVVVRAVESSLHS